MQTNGKSAQVPGYAWVILALVFFVSVAAPLNMAKVPPIMSAIRGHFGISLTSAGWLMSVFSIVGVALALPSGFVLGRLGPRNSGVIALACLALGSVLGAMTDAMPLLLFSRVLEGIGMCFMSIMAPAIIAAWFPAEKRGLPMGLWALWVPIGMISTYLIAPRLSSLLHWRWVWWMGAGYSVLLLALYIVLFRMPEGAKAEAVDTKKELEHMRRALKKRDPWLIALSFGAINAVSIGLNTFMPTFFENVAKYTPETASLTVSVVMALCMVAVVLGGVISDKTGSRRLCMSIPYFLAAGFLAFLFVPGQMGIVCYTLFAMLSALAVTPTFAAAPELVPHEEAATSLAILTIGQNTGMFLGPVFIAFMAESFSWSAAGYACIPFVLLAGASAWFVRIR